MSTGRKSNPTKSQTKGNPPTKGNPAKKRSLDLEVLAPTKTRATAPAESEPKAPPPERLPTQFGRYRLIRELGRGGMGAVVLAEDTQLGRQVALKIPFLNKTSDTRTLKRFAREAKAAAALSHPNLCAVYDFGTFGKHHFLSMAYIEGRPLQSYLNGGTTIPQRTAAAIIKKTASALEHAHQRGVIHRDLKPSNIMIEPNLGPVVTDFGLARCSGDDGEPQLTQDGVAIGTPSYMSPEQLDGDSSQIGPSSDIFSLGLILYEMLIGERRFQGKVASIIGQILTKDPVPLREIRPNVDPLLDQICRKMMARNPADRYASMREVANVMRTYLKGELSSFDGRPATREVPSDPELFFAELAAAESETLPPSTNAGAGHDETVPNLARPLVISDGDSRSSRVLRRRERREFSRKAFIAIAVGLLAIVIGYVVWIKNSAGLVKASFDPPGPAARQSQSGEENSPPIAQAPARPADRDQATGQKGDEASDPAPPLSAPALFPSPESGPDETAKIQQEEPVETEPTSAPEQIAEEKPPVWLKDAKGKLQFQAVVTKTIHGSTTEKKLTTPRSALSELLKLEQRQVHQDKSLKDVRVVISINGNAFEFLKAKEARIAAAAFEDGVPQNIQVEEVLARLKKLNPGLVKPREQEPTSADEERFREEFEAIYKSQIVPFMSRMNNGRGPLSQSDVDLAQVRFEKECRKIKGLPEDYPIPPLRYRFLPAGVLMPNLVTSFVGDSWRLKDQTQKGQLIKRIAEALNAGTLIEEDPGNQP